MTNHRSIRGRAPAAKFTIMDEETGMVVNAESNPGTDMSNPATFGVINSDQGARSVQLGARIRV